MLVQTSPGFLFFIFFTVDGLSLSSHPCTTCFAYVCFFDDERRMSERAGAGGWVGPRLLSASLLHDWMVVTTGGTLVSQANNRRRPVGRGSAATAVVCVGG